MKLQVPSWAYRGCCQRVSFLSTALSDKHLPFLATGEAKFLCPRAVDNGETFSLHRCLPDCGRPGKACSQRLGAVGCAVFLDDVDVPFDGRLDLPHCHSDLLPSKTSVPHDTSAHRAWPIMIEHRWTINESRTRQLGVASLASALIAAKKPLSPQGASHRVHRDCPIRWWHHAVGPPGQVMGSQVSACTTEPIRHGNSPSSVHSKP